MRVADAHNDLLLAVLHQAERGQSDSFGDFWLPRLRAGGVVLQFLAVFGEASTGAGLTTLGEEAVAEMERLGMLVDVSHLSSAGFDHVAGISTRPFVATHSSCHALCPHPRNLTDDQLRDVADSGGVVGINSFGGFLSTDEPSLDDYLAHIEHAVAVAGPVAVGLGCDFMEHLLDVLDPILGAGLVDSGNLPFVAGMRDPSDLAPFGALLTHRLGTETARRVAGDNWIDLLKRVLPSESHRTHRE